MSVPDAFEGQTYRDFEVSEAKPGAINTVDDLNRFLQFVRERPLKTITGHWLNIVRFRGERFIQGDIRDENAPGGNVMNVAALVEGVDEKGIAGFWPEVTGYPIEKPDGDRIASYLARQGKNDVELIVPERNTMRPVPWGRFNESPEFNIYREFIYPAIIEAIEEIGGHHDSFKTSLCMECLRRTGQSGTEASDRLLDMGCGCGDLIEAIQRTVRDRRRDPKWECCGCGNLTEISRGFPAIECWGIDNNPDNVEAAAEKKIPGICLGDCEAIESVLPPDLDFDLMVFCGLLNRQVTTHEKALRILTKALPRLRSGGHIIMTGYTSCHLTAKDLSGMNLEVLRQSIPENIFKDYRNYSLRQLYVARKM